MPYRRTKKRKQASVPGPQASSTDTGAEKTNLENNDGDYVATTKRSRADTLGFFTDDEDITKIQGDIGIGNEAVEGEVNEVQMNTWVLNDCLRKDGTTTAALTNFISDIRLNSWTTSERASSASDSNDVNDNNDTSEDDDDVDDNNNDDDDTKDNEDDDFDVETIDFINLTTSSRDFNVNTVTESSYSRPPADLICNRSFGQAIDLAHLEGKLVLVSIQSSNEASCRSLNETVLSDLAVKRYIKAHFIFWHQLNSFPPGKRYLQLYPALSIPHLAILDPLTSERVLLLSTSGACATPACFLADLRAFVDAHKRSCMADKLPESPLVINEIKEDEEPCLETKNEISKRISELELVISQEPVEDFVVIKFMMFIAGDRGPLIRKFSLLQTVDALFHYAASWLPAEMQSKHCLEDIRLVANRRPISFCASTSLKEINLTASTVIHVEVDDGR